MTTPHDKGAHSPPHGPGSPSPAHDSGQFGQLGATGQGTDLTQQMDSAGPQTDDQGNAVELIPWNPAGKIDDEVERRTWPAGHAPGEAGHTPQGDVHTGAVKGGTHQGQEDTGPGRYGGPTGQTMAARRYAGATDDAPTDPVAGATTTLAAGAAAEGSDHTMRAPGAPSGHETWEGGTASDQAMHAKQDFEHAGHTAPTAPAGTHAAPASGHPAAPATGGQPAGSSTTGQHSATPSGTHTAGSSSTGGQHSAAAGSAHTTPQHSGSGHGETH